MFELTGTVLACIGSNLSVKMGLVKLWVEAVSGQQSAGSFEHSEFRMS